MVSPVIHEAVAFVTSDAPFSLLPHHRDPHLLPSPPFQGECRHDPTSSNPVCSSRWLPPHLAMQLIPQEPPASRHTSGQQEAGAMCLWEGQALGGGGHS